MALMMIGSLCLVRAASIPHVNPPDLVEVLDRIDGASVHREPFGDGRNANTSLKAHENLPAVVRHSALASTCITNIEKGKRTN